MSKTLKTEINRVYVEKDKEKLEDTLLRLTKLEQDYLNSWAAGTRTEYENRIKHDLFAKLTKVIIRIAGYIGLFASLLGGAAIFVSLPNAVKNEVEAVVPKEVENEFEKTSHKTLNSIKETYREEHEKLASEYKWQNYHDIGYLLRKYLDVFIRIDNAQHEKNNTEHTVQDEFNQELIEQFYDDAITQFTKASKVALQKSTELKKSSSYWELGKLYYQVALSMKKFNVKPDCDKAIKSFEFAIKSYSKNEIKKRSATANFDLAEVYIGRSQRLKTRCNKDSTTLEQDREQAMKYMKKALDEFKEVNIEKNPWIKGRNMIGNINKIIRLLKKGSTKEMDEIEKIIKLLREK